MKNIVFGNRLHGAAKFVDKNDRKVLYLDGTQGTYAETSAIPFQQTDLTIAVWIKLVRSLSRRQEIYADWSSPYQFRFAIEADGILCFQGRRNVEVVSNMIVKLLAQIPGKGAPFFPRCIENVNISRGRKSACASDNQISVCLFVRLLFFLFWDRKKSRSPTASQLPVGRSNHYDVNHLTVEKLAIVCNVL